MQSELEMMAYHEPEDEPKHTTERIRRGIVQALHDLGIMNMLNVSADNAEKAYKTAQRIEQRELRAKAAADNAYKMEVKQD